MFLAQARVLQVYEMAEIKDGVLEAQAGRKPPTRQGEPEGPSRNGLEHYDRLGVPARGRGTAGGEDPNVPGEQALRSVELLTGAGGLALGIEASGFHHDTVVERNKYCCDTIRENQARGFPALQGWRRYPDDIPNFNYRSINGQIEPF